MRVSIDHREITTGLIFKKQLYQVIVKVEFSQEELSIIKSRKLKDYTVVERDWDALMQDKVAKHPEYYNTVARPNLKIGTLVKGADVYTLEIPSAAKVYEGRVVDGLKELKGFLEGNAEVAQSKTFEL